MFHIVAETVPVTYTSFGTFWLLSEQDINYQILEALVVGLISLLKLDRAIKKTTSSLFISIFRTSNFLR